MTSSLEILLMLSLIVLAFVAVYTHKLRRAAGYLGAFSLLCSFAFLLYNAPDVAIAEAVIGCTISTILFLIAIKKRHVLTIYYIEGDAASETIKKERRELTASLERFLIRNEFEPQVISTHLEDAEICEKGCFDLLVIHEKNDIAIYSGGLMYIEPQIQEFLSDHKPPHLDISFHSISEKNLEVPPDDPS